MVGFGHVPARERASICEERRDFWGKQSVLNSKRYLGRTRQARLVAAVHPQSWKVPDTKTRSVGGQAAGRVLSRGHLGGGVSRRYPAQSRFWPGSMLTRHNEHAGEVVRQREPAIRHLRELLPRVRRGCAGRLHVRPCSNWVSSGRIVPAVLLPVCSSGSNGRTSGLYRNADLRQNECFSQICATYHRT